jgi:hypothetical protein
MARQLGVQKDLADTPTPGGVGFGFFFTDAFKTAWGAGTAIMFDAVCPAQLGGNVTDFLFLTSTNRSTMGLEALVSYNGQDGGTFAVFDWSLESPSFVVGISMSALHDYTEAGASPHAQRTLTIRNATFSIGGMYYRNEAHLYNRLQERWDLLYSRDYASDEARQKSGGGWAPIVETFQDLYIGTNPLGFKRTFTAQADAFGNWSDWSLLKPGQAVIRNDNKGFEVRDLNPNFGFTLIS